MELVRSREARQEPHGLCSAGQAAEQNAATPELAAPSENVTDELIGRAYERFHRLQSSRPSCPPSSW